MNQNTENPSAGQAGAVQPACQTLPVATPLLGLMPDFLHEDDITIERLLRLFRQAYMPTELLDGPALRVRTDSQIKVDVYLSRERRQLTMFCWYAFEPGRDLIDQLKLANAINDGVAWVRAAVRPSDALLLDITLAFDGGMPTLQVIEGLRRLVRVGQAAIRQYDKDGLVK